MWLRYLLSDRRVRYLLKDRPVTVAIDVTNKTTVTSPTLGPAEPPLLPQLNHLQACHQFSAWRLCPGRDQVRPRHGGAGSGAGAKTTISFYRGCEIMRLALARGARTM